MKFNIHHHHHERNEALDQILELLEAIMASQAQLETDLQAVTDHVTKIGNETSTILAKVTDLEAAILNAGNTTPEVDAAMEALKAQVKVVDDLVADVP